MTLEEDLSSNVNICPQNKDQADTKQPQNNRRKCYCGHWTQKSSMSLCSLNHKIKMVGKGPLDPSIPVSA